MPDGQDVSFPDDMPKEQIKSIIATKFPEFAQQAPPEQEGIAAGAGHAFGESLANAVPFGQKITSGIGAVGAKAYDIASGEGVTEGISIPELYEQAQQNYAATSEAHPMATLGGSLTGIAGTLPLASTKMLYGSPDKIGKALNVIPQVLQKAGQFASTGNLASRAAKGALVAAPAGALYGAGDAKPGEMLEGAKYGAGLGAAAGAALPVAAAALVPIARPILNKIFPKKPLPSGVLSDVIDDARNAGLIKNVDPSLDNFGAKRVIDALKKDYPQDWRRVLQHSLETGTPLIESGGTHMKRLAETTGLYPSGQARGEKFFEERIAGVGDRLGSSISKNISNVVDSDAAISDILTKGRAKAAPLYEKALSEGKSISDSRIMSLIDTPELKRAMKDGLDIQRIESATAGTKFDPTDFAITAFNEAGDPIIGKVPNMRLLDAAKRGLDVMIEKETDKITGKVTERGRALISLKSEYLKNLDRVNPVYAAARKAAGDYLSNKQALQDGLQFDKLSPTQVLSKFKKLSEPEKESYKAGIAEKIRKEIGKVSEGSNPYNRIFGSPEKKDRLRAVLSPSEFTKLEKNLRDEKYIFELRNTVLGGSATGKRRLMTESGELATVAIDAVSGGLLAAGIRAAKTAVKKSFDGISDDKANAVAKYLYETDREAFEKILGGKVGAKEHRKIFDAIKDSEIIKQKRAK